MSETKTGNVEVSLTSRKMTTDFFSQKQIIFDRWAPNYDCLLTTILYQAFHKRLLEFTELPSQPQVLDIGCGTGRLFHRLAVDFPNLRGIGLDLSEEMIRVARLRNEHRERLVYRQGNAESLPFGDGEFDAVFCTISFLHYPNPQQVCQEINRVLLSGGRFYLVDYTVREDFGCSNFPFLLGGMKLYSREKREMLATYLGWECLGHYYLLGPVMLTVFQK